MATSPNNEEETIVATIQKMGWLQGDIIHGSALAEHVPQSVIDGALGGRPPSYWVLVSHSCSIHARRYDAAPMVEWLALKEVKKKPLGGYLNSNSPRVLHIQIEEKLYLEAKIERRIWTQRSVLTELKKGEERQLDPDTIRTLSFWLSHSYNRIAMPDKLVERLKFRNDEGEYIGLGANIDNFLDANAQFLKGAWISFNPKEEITDSASYTIAFRFLVKPKYVRNLHDLEQQINAITSIPKELTNGLEVESCEITPMQDFTMLDAEDFTHYNSSDWLSLKEDDEDPESE